MMRFMFFFLFSFSVFSEEIKHTIYFETDKSNVSQIEKNRLYSFVENLKSEDLQSVKISGFCDDVGSNSYNLDLSLDRAQNIKNLLILNNVKSEQIVSVNGKGEVFLELYSSKNPDIVRALNRKVEVVFNTKKNVPEVSFEIKKGNTIVLENILFLTGYSFLVPSSKKNLEDLYIKVKDESFNFIIQGHVCCTPGTKDALDRATKKRNLSLMRAKYVYDFLIKKGVSSSRMTYEGLAHKFPLGGDPEKDRRVEILITSNF